MRININDIEIFDFIYDVNKIKKENENVESNNYYIKEINEKLKKKGLTLIKFLNKYKNKDIIFVDKNMENDSFPQYTSNGKKIYLKFKEKQLKKILAKNPEYSFTSDQLKKDLNINCLLGIKEIIETCIDNGSVRSNGNYWVNIPNTNTGRIMDEKLEVNINIEKNNKKPNTIIQNIKHQNNINCYGGKNIFKDNDFSNGKKELEKEKFSDKLSKIIEKIVKIFSRNRS